MNNYVVGILEYLLDGVADTQQIIFETYIQREDVKLDVTEQPEENGSDNKSDSKKRKFFTSHDKTDGSKEEGSIRGTSDDEVAQTTEIKVKKDQRIRILTSHGQKFVNTMLDILSSSRSDDTMLNDTNTVEQYLNPDFNLFKVLNTSNLNYYSKEVEMYSTDTAKCVLNYEKLDAENIEWEDDDNILSPHEYKLCWEGILNATKRNIETISVSKKCTKPVKYWSDIKLGYFNNKLIKKIDASISHDDMMLNSILEPKWKLDPLIFGEDKVDQEFSELDKILWSISKRNTETKIELDGTVTKSRPNPKKDKINKSRNKNKNTK